MKRVSWLSWTLEKVWYMDSVLDFSLVPMSSEAFSLMLVGSLVWYRLGCQSYGWIPEIWLIFGLINISLGRS